jgi:hypothetical protein
LCIVVANELIEEENEFGGHPSEPEYKGQYRAGAGRPVPRAGTRLKALKIASPIFFLLIIFISVFKHNHGSLILLASSYIYA